MYSENYIPKMRNLYTGDTAQEDLHPRVLHIGLVRKKTPRWFAPRLQIGEPVATDPARLVIFELISWSSLAESQMGP